MGPPDHTGLQASFWDFWGFFPPEARESVLLSHHLTAPLSESLNLGTQTFNCSHAILFRFICARWSMFHPVKPIFSYRQDFLLSCAFGLLPPFWSSSLQGDR